MDHPCVCGEKKSSSVILMTMRGSPLRMRGKGFRIESLRIFFGITPAYAGKRQHLPRRQLWHRDHPCVCGEKPNYLFQSLVAQGSPLRMRGKVDILLLKCYCHRITPAYAGKRLKRSRKIVLFKSTVNHFHLVCNKPDTANDNLQWLGAAAWF